MSSFDEEDYLQISGIQHFSFCRRQWALIHVEHLWKDNLRTVEGSLLHERTHDEGVSKKRVDLLTVRGMHVSSKQLGVSGVCDTVEFHRCTDGVHLFGREGKWKPYPVEYKRGMPKTQDADRLQICCQVMCLEEMLATSIQEGALFYGEPRRREEVIFTQSLRDMVRHEVEEMHKYAMRGYTPKVKVGPFCRACSLNELCLPKLCKRISVTAYVEGKLQEET